MPFQASKQSRIKCEHCAVSSLIGQRARKEPLKCWFTLFCSFPASSLSWNAKHWTPASSSKERRVCAKGRKKGKGKEREREVRETSLWSLASSVHKREGSTTSTLSCSRSPWLEQDRRPSRYGCEDHLSCQQLKNRVALLNSTPASPKILGPLRSSTTPYAGINDHHGLPATRPPSASCSSSGSARPCTLPSETAMRVSAQPQWQPQWQP